jgi:hypothetical protein
LTGAVFGNTLPVQNSLFQQIYLALGLNEPQEIITKTNTRGNLLCLNYFVQIGNFVGDEKKDKRELKFKSQRAEINIAIQGQLFAPTRTLY